MRFLQYWRPGVVFLSVAVADLCIPSLPHREYHLAYWIAALMLEIVLIVALSPLAQHRKTRL